MYGGFGADTKSQEHIKEDKTKYLQNDNKTVILFGSELWKLKQRGKGMLEIWQRKVLRKIYGGKKERDQWERRTNNELMQMYCEIQ